MNKNEYRKLRSKCDDIRRELWQMQIAIDHAHDKLCNMVEYLFDLEEKTESDEDSATKGIIDESNDFIQIIRRNAL